MEARTLEALRGSIEKWLAISERRGEDYGSGNCPLCTMFYRKTDGEGKPCSGCPVRERAGTWGCMNTPYDRFNPRVDVVNPAEYTDEDVAAARAELEFLRSLLP